VDFGLDARGGAELGAGVCDGVGASGNDEDEDEDGAEDDGADGEEFACDWLDGDGALPFPCCAHATALNTTTIPNRILRHIRLFYRALRVARNASRQRPAVSSSENRLPSCSIR
jgi:hypothetical protein